MKRKNQTSIYKYVPVLALLAGATFGWVKGDFDAKGYKKVEVEQVSYSDQARERQKEAYEVWKNAVEGVSRYELMKAEAKAEYEREIASKKQVSIETTVLASPRHHEKTQTLVKMVGDEEKEDIKSRIKTRIKPTGYAGSLKNNGNVRVIKEENYGTRVTEAEGLASWYSAKDSSPRTVTGADVDDNKPTVAVNERLGLPLPSRVKITNLENGLAIEAIATDHGPYKFNKYGNAVWKTVKTSGKTMVRYIPHDTRIIDTSMRVAKDLGFYGKGLAHVKVEYLGKL